MILTLENKDTCHCSNRHRLIIYVNLVNKIKNKVGVCHQVLHITYVVTD